jgi:hypothetical protein
VAVHFKCRTIKLAILGLTGGQGHEIRVKIVSRSGADAVAALQRQFWLLAVSKAPLLEMRLSMY